MIVSTRREFTKGSSYDSGVTATFTEAKVALEALVEQVKLDYLISCRTDPEKLEFPFLEASIGFRVKNANPHLLEDTLWAEIIWRKYGRAEFFNCKERLKLVTIAGSRYRDDKPTIFWDIVKAFFDGGCV
jgi:hypothetical protein